MSCSLVAMYVYPQSEGGPAQREGPSCAGSTGPGGGVAGKHER